MLGGSVAKLFAASALMRCRACAEAEPVVRQNLNLRLVESSKTCGIQGIDLGHGSCGTTMYHGADAPDPADRSPGHVRGPDEGPRHDGGGNRGRRTARVAAPGAAARQRHVLARRDDWRAVSPRSRRARWLVDSR